MSEYTHCPRCGSTDIEVTDYENEAGVVDTDGRGCRECHWEGDVAELEAE